LSRCARAGTSGVTSAASGLTLHHLRRAAFGGTLGGDFVAAPQRALRRAFSVWSARRTPWVPGSAPNARAVLLAARCDPFAAQDLARVGWRGLAARKGSLLSFGAFRMVRDPSVVSPSLTHWCSSEKPVNESSFGEDGWGSHHLLPGSLGSRFLEIVRDFFSPPCRAHRSLSLLHSRPHSASLRLSVGLKRATRRTARSSRTRLGVVGRRERDLVAPLTPL